MTKFALLFLLACSDVVYFPDTASDYIEAYREECALGIQLSDDCEIDIIYDCYINEQYEDVCVETTYSISPENIVSADVTQFCRIECI